jgi:hypothetical protein
MRRDRIVEANWHCEECGVLAYVLQLHHETYERLGAEFHFDLRLLCVPCHRRADVRRAARERRDLYRRRLDGWARKVHGDDWRDWLDPEDVAEEFEDFCALQDEGFSDPWSRYRDRIIRANERESY